MLTEDKVIEIFVMANEFCKVFNAMLRRRSRCSAIPYLRQEISLSKTQFKSRLLQYNICNNGNFI